MGCPTVVELGETLTFSCCTHDPDTGILTDADAVPVYWVYEDETGTSINATTPLSDPMAKLDDAHTTGFYTETITCSTANGYETGKTYTIYITAAVGAETGGICYSFKCSSRLTSIEADTNALQADWADGGRLDLLLDAVKAKTDNLPSSIPRTVAIPDFAFVMYSSIDHVTPSTGLTVTGYISQDGGAFAALAGAVTAISNGVYKVDLTGAEMTADIVVLRFTATGADDVVVVLKTDT
jgi:hypothetical protein